MDDHDTSGVFLDLCGVGAPPPQHHEDAGKRHSEAREPVGCTCAPMRGLGASV
jgi:hypothetical protein